MFRVGQKVVCVTAGDIDGGNGGVWYEGEAPTEGAIYTVASTFQHPFLDEPMVTLVEIKRCPECMAINGHEGYGAHRFRPIVERETDISIFKAMLTPAGRKRETV